MGPNMSCVAQCPADKGFENRVTNNQPQCVYKSDTQYSVSLNPLQILTYNQNSQPPTLETLKTYNPQLHERYTAESKRVDEQIAIVLGNIDKQTKIDNAFKELQKAENVRDQAPEAYQQARINYYTLVKGDTWKQEEQERIAKVEVDPEIRTLKTRLNEAEMRSNTQKQTVDIVNKLKDNVLTLKDDFKYSVDTFQRQLGKLKDQILFDRRKREEQSNESTWELLDRVLNYTIVGVLLFAIWKIYKLFFSKKTEEVTPSTTQEPESTGAVKNLLDSIIKLLPGSEPAVK